eukprot:COSAG01_NODE_2796_length_7058_cov_12.294295_4_plen_125_part_00
MQVTESEVPADEVYETGAAEEGPSPVSRPTDVHFDRYDLNGDGLLDNAELEQMMTGLGYHCALGGAIICVQLERWSPVESESTAVTNWRVPFCVQVQGCAKLRQRNGSGFWCTGYEWRWFHRQG